MEVLLVIIALAFIAGAGVIVYRNKKLQNSLLDFAKEIQDNPEVQAAQKKIANNLKAKATEEIVKEAKKVTKKK
jgi:hypothetical protein